VTDTLTLFDPPQTHTRRYNRDRALGAREWVDANPVAWELCDGWVRRDIRLGIRPSFKRYAENLRGGVNQPDGHRRQIDNSIVAGLVDLYCEEHPARAGYFVRRGRS
jgi:hypothetical protein